MNSVFLTLTILLLTGWAFAQDLSGQLVDSQSAQAAFEKDYAEYRSWAIGDDTSALNKTDNPELQTFIEIAERAQQRIFTPENNELRKMAREFETKLLELQTSDMGRWVATQPEMVSTFLVLDSDVLFLSDVALDIRRKRLQAAIDSLHRYTPETQGKFDPSASPAVSTILQDANWVEENYVKLTKRLALLSDLEKSFPHDENWSNLPTLVECKTKQRAERFVLESLAAENGRRRGEIASAEMKEQSAFDIEVRRATTQVKGQEKLAEVQRKLMEAEFGKQTADLQSQIRDAEIEIRRIEGEMVNKSAEAEKQRVVEYLKSTRVRNLLAPFCSSGLSEANSGAGHRRIDSLTPGPMSYSRLAAYNCFAPQHQNMSLLIAIANNRRNDRPAWGVSDKDYNDVGNIHENIDGEMVNPYIEAQRILRENSAILIELGMLRD